MNKIGTILKTIGTLVKQFFQLLNIFLLQKYLKILSFLNKVNTKLPTIARPDDSKIIKFN